METNTTPVVPTAASEWKGKINVEGTALRLPSDNVALVRQISPAAFLESGMIPDPLRPMVQKAINSKKGLPPTAQRQMMDDPKLLAGAMELMDTTLCHVVIEPEISMPPKCTACGEYANREQHKRDGDKFNHKYVEGPREAGVLYADQVDMMDKQFVFQWALMGTRDVAKFRGEFDESVGSLAAEPGVPDQT